jgi:hypothetical protein
LADEILTPSEEDSATPRTTVVSCWLCGILQHKLQMVPDGSAACADIRWYCKDAQACTDRWSSRRQLEAAGPLAAALTESAVAALDQRLPASSAPLTSA